MNSVKYWLIVPFLLCYFLVSSQEVIVTLTAKQMDLPLELDTIILINLSQPDTACLTDLPPGVTSYEIDLMKGKVIGGVDEPGAPSGITLLSSQPGLVKFIIRVEKPESFHFSLFDLTGRAVLEKNIAVHSGASYFTLKCCMVPFTILRISGGKFDACFKCPGDCSNSGTADLSVIHSGEASSEGFKASALLFPESFDYTPGDAIKFTAHKTGWYSNSIAYYTHHLDSFTVYISCPCINQPVVYDYEGNAYQTVQIGSQCWMRENIRSTRYADGTPLKDGTGIGDQGDDCISKYWFDYNDDPSISQEYGKLYTASAAVNGEYILTPDDWTKKIQGICPNGWHVARDMDWMRLEAYIGMGQDTSFVNEWRGTDQAFQLREAGEDHWKIIGGTNKSGFNAYASGRRIWYGDFDGIRGIAYWWDSRVTSKYCSGCIRHIAVLMGGIMSGCTSNNTSGYSVRCLKD